MNFYSVTKIADGVEVGTARSREEAIDLARGYADESDMAYRVTCRESFTVMPRQTAEEAMEDRILGKLGLNLKRCIQCGSPSSGRVCRDCAGSQMQ